MRYVCEVWITQIYKLRKHETWDTEIRGQEWQYNLLLVWYLYHWNIPRYPREGSGCWLEHSCDNWFTLFAWLRLMSALIKITIRNSMLIISYCENIITESLIWIITGLDILKARTQQTESRFIDCENVSVRHSELPVSASCFRYWDEITPPSVPTQWQTGAGGGGARK